MRLNQREQLFEVVAEQRTLHHPLASKHPVAIAADSINFTVMSDVALRMRTVPTGECIRGEPAVDHRQMRDVVRILKIREKGSHLIGSQHPFVNHDLGRQRADIELQCLRQRPFADRVTGSLAYHEKLSLKRVLIQSRSGGNKQLLKMRHGCAG